MNEDDKDQLKTSGLSTNFIVRDLIIWFTFIFVLPVILLLVYILSKEKIQNNVPETHDWFRKPLYKVLLNRSKAVCNDGSPASYYIRLSESKVWMILLEGGYYCYDQASCSQRYLNSHNLTTSVLNKNFKFSNGILSSDPIQNPNWFNINVVEIPYCSSDLWTGRTKSGDFNFMGYEIISAVFDSLITNTNIKDSELIMLAGVSAGGIGALMNANRIQKILNLNAPNAKFKIIIDSSWQLDLPYSYLCSGNKCIINQFFNNAIKYWNAQLPEECSVKQNGTFWNCFLPSKILNFIKIPIFVIQSKFDETQLLDQFNHISSNSENKIAEMFKIMDKKLRHNLKDIDAYYVPSCIAHITLTNKNWNYFKVSNVKISDALYEWVYKEKKQQLYDSCQWPDCHGSCPLIVSPDSNKVINSFEYLAYLGLIDRNQIANKYNLSLRYLQNLNYFKLMKLILN